MPTIQEKLGANKHSYIPQNKRGGKRVRDAEGKTAMIYRWVKEHEGLPITLLEIAGELEMNHPTVAKYMAKLIQQGKVTVEKKRYRRIYRLGSGGGPRSNGAVVVKREPAKFSASQIEQLQLAAMTYMFGKDSIFFSAAEDQAIGGFVRHMNGLVNQLKEELSGEVKREQG